MRTIILGGGVIGVTTAYYLARDGHEVIVLDRQPGVGRETSFANAGLIAPGHAYAWASPRAPKILLQSLYREDAALRFRFRLDPRMWAWNLRFLANCTAERNRVNTLRKLALCRYSQQAHMTLREETGLQYDQITRGCLYLYRDPAHFEAGVRNTAMLREAGLTLEPVDPDRCVAIEPALADAKHRLAGGIYAPSDESGDSLLFTERLARLCEDLGVTFKLGSAVTALSASGDRVDRVVTDQGAISGDAYVLALGSYSPLLARGLGIDLPVYPIKGYSLTLPIEEDGAPTIGGVDEGHLVAFARLGDRLRLTATAEFAGYDTSHQPKDFATMLRVARELFPRGGAFDKPQYWACLRPMTPDGPPVLGRAPRHRNLWLNTGHGHMGWTMACGSGRITADLIAGRKPELDISGLTLARY